MSDFDIQYDNRLMKYTGSDTVVTIPEGVKHIHQGCFGDYGNDSAITSITLPSTLYDYSSNAFENCPALEQILVHPDNPTFCSVNGILFSKDMTELFCYPAAKAGKYTIPDGVKTIHAYAFYGSHLTGIQFPETTESI